MRQSNKQSKPIDKGKAAKQMMSAATAAGYNIPVPPIDAAANRGGGNYRSAATDYVSACGRGYGRMNGLKQHLHGIPPNRKGCADPRCISQAIEYPIVRKASRRNQRV
jgi:hypothetical protein